MVNYILFRTYPNISNLNHFFKIIDLYIYISNNAVLIHDVFWYSFEKFTQLNYLFKVTFLYTEYQGNWDKKMIEIVCVDVIIKRYYVT